MKIREGEQWIPKRITYAFGEPVVEIVQPSKPVNHFFSDLELDTPKKVVRIPLMDIHLPDVDDGLSPTGFIFHTPRSGSTLVSRMLTVSEKHVIIVEPEPINSLLSNQSYPSVDSRWLRQLLRLYRLAFQPECTGFFVKASSWAILKLALFEAAFPETPACMIYRNPVEVMVQILQRRTGWMSDSARTFILGLEVSECEKMSLERYSAEALARFFNAASTGLSPMLLIDYETLPESVADHLLRHFALVANSKQQQSMLEQGRNDSEDWSGQSRYIDDSVFLNSHATDKIKCLAKEIVLPALRELEYMADENGLIKAI